jgi:hypothetical protein
MQSSVYQSTAIKPPKNKLSVPTARRFSAITLIRRPQREALKMIASLSASKRLPRSFSIPSSAVNLTPSTNMPMSSLLPRSNSKRANITSYGATFSNLKAGFPASNLYPNSGMRTATRTMSTHSTTSSITLIHGAPSSIRMRMFLMTMRTVIRSATWSERTTTPARRRRPRILLV